MTYPQRSEYLDGKVSFVDFYRSVAKAAGVTLKASAVLPRVKAALEAGDEHLNTIPLPEWDRMAAGAAPRIASALKLHGDFYSLGGGVCVMKQAARDAVEQVQA